MGMLLLGPPRHCLLLWKEAIAGHKPLASECRPSTLLLKWSLSACVYGKGELGLEPGWGPTLLLSLWSPCFRSLWALMAVLCFVSHSAKPRGTFPCLVEVSFFLTLAPRQTHIFFPIYYLGSVIITNVFILLVVSLSSTIPQGLWGKNKNESVSANAKSSSNDKPIQR